MCKMAVVLELLALVAIACLVAYRYWISSLRYWKTKGVDYITPVPFFGNYKDVILSRRSEAEVVQKLYCQLNGKQFGGIFHAQTPVLLLRDPDLIKQILGKDFSIFPTRGIEFDEKLDPLSGHIFNLEGDRWRSIRSKLTPAFTPRKLKCMFQQLNGYANDLCDYLEDHAVQNRAIEMTRVLTQFSTDVLCSSFFGLQVNAMKNQDSEFYNIGEKIVATSKNSFHQCISAISQRLTKLTTPQSEITKFFCTVAKDIVRHREEHGIISNDFMHLLTQLINSAECQGLPDEAMAAQMYICFMAGFEKPPAVLSFCLHELAMAPTLQSRLRTEVDAVQRASGGQMTAEDLQKMPYIDKVVAETLRKYPVEANLTRVSRAPYTIPGTTVHLPEGTRVLIPVFAIQRDPQYYPDPELFDPDRDAGPSCTYLPFGEGPRMCIGYKFGLMQIKVALAMLLSKYQFSMSSRMTVPSQLAKRGRVTSLAAGTWLNIALRNTVSSVKDGLVSTSQQENVVRQTMVSNTRMTDSSAELPDYEISKPTISSRLLQNQSESLSSSINRTDTALLCDDDSRTSFVSAALQEELAIQTAPVDSRKKTGIDARTRGSWQSAAARDLGSSRQPSIL